MGLIQTSLRQALRHLYDPAELRRNLLYRRLITAEHAGPLALQELLVAEIEALKPEPHLASHTDAWRIYRILTHRFVEQFTQQEVATNLGLSIRQLRREERRAIQVLADHLLRRYPQHFAELSEVGMDKEEAIASQVQEMAWLERSLPSAPTDVVTLVESLLETTRPLLAALPLKISFSAAPDLPTAVVQATSVRQALLSLLTAAARAAPEGKIDIRVEGTATTVSISLRITALTEECDQDAFDEVVTIARQLLTLSAGKLDVLTPRQADCAILLRVRLPAARATTVLVIDDNIDTLHLYERYLAQSPYRFAGQAVPQEALDAASRLVPAAIILDVMLPEVDGWELLGRLRAAPATRAIPVIVSTILPQEDFALTLGAAAFLRKPFTQAQLLEVLAQVLEDASA